MYKAERTTVGKKVKNKYDPQIGEASKQIAETGARAEEFSREFYEKNIVPLLEEMVTSSQTTRDQQGQLFDLNFAQTQQQNQRYNEQGIPAEDRYYAAMQQLAGESDALYNKYVQPSRDQFYNVANQEVQSALGRARQFADPAAEQFYNISREQAAAQQGLYNQYSLPAQQAYYNMVQDYSSEDHADRMATAAIGDVRTALGAQQAMNTRQAAAMGMQGPALLALQQDANLRGAAMQANAATQARNAAKMLGMQLKSDAAQFGRADTAALMTSANAAQYGRGEGANAMTGAGALASYVPQINTTKAGLYGDAANFGRGGMSGTLQFGQAAAGNSMNSFGTAQGALGAAGGAAGTRMQGMGLNMQGQQSIMGNYTSLGNTAMNAQSQMTGAMYGAIGSALGTAGGLWAGGAFGGKPAGGP